MFFSPEIRDCSRELGDRPYVGRLKAAKELRQGLCFHQHRAMVAQRKRSVSSIDHHIKVYYSNSTVWEKTSNK